MVVSYSCLISTDMLANNQERAADQVLATAMLACSNTLFYIFADTRCRWMISNLSEYVILSS